MNKLKLEFPIWVLWTFLFIIGAFCFFILGSAVTKPIWEEKGMNDTLNNITLMSEVGNTYVIYQVNKYNGTLPIYVIDELNETQIWTLNNLTRIK